jgi:hypothetical protein
MVIDIGTELDEAQHAEETNPNEISYRKVKASPEKRGKQSKYKKRAAKCERQFQTKSSQRRSFRVSV